MNRGKRHWTMIKLTDNVDDVLWIAHDYLWVTVEAEIYLSRDQGETFKKTNWLTFAFINTKHMLGRLYRKWIRWIKK